MDRISAASARLESASTLPAVLDAAYDAFEGILAVLRHHQEHAGGAFPSFVIAAAAAGNGRDDIADAPSLPPAAAPASPAAAAGLMAGASITEVALTIGGLSQALAARLTAAASSAPGPADRASCQHAAHQAARITSLLAWARQP